MSQRFQQHPQPTEVLWSIDQLNETAETSEAYFSQLLSILVDYLGASSGYIWQPTADSLQPLVKAVSENEPGADNYQQQCQLALDFYSRQPSQAQFVSSSDKRTEQPDEICLLTPLFDHEHCFGVASFVTRVAHEYEAASHVEFLDMAMDRVRRGYLFRNFAQAAEQLAITTNAQEVTAGIGKHLEAKPLAFDVVNRLQKYLEVDRVALAFKRGKKCRLKGVSNQAVLERRSNVIKGLEQLAAQVARTEEAVFYPHQADELAPSLRTMVDRFLDVSNTLSIGLIPVFAEPKRRDDPEDIAATIKSDEQRRECVAVLTLEAMEEPLDREKAERRWQRIEEPVSNAIASSRKYDGLFLMPLWRLLGQFADLYRGHTQRKALLITAALAGVIGALVLIPAEFKLRGDGDIRPVELQHVFAQSDGTVDELLFTVGNPIRKGDLLVRLKNPELATRIAELEGRLHESEKQLETFTIQRVTKSFETEQEERELIRQAVSTEARVEGLADQLKVLRDREQQLLVESPMDGQVVTWDSDQRLKDRPVKQGDRLFTMALPEGAWEIELRIPDKRAGYLLKEWPKRVSQGQPMRVSFVLASNPSEVFSGVVADVAPGSNIDEQASENVVRVKIEIPPDEFSKIKHVMPGTTVIGHIHVGRASIGYSKLFEFFDWTQRMWFKFIS